MKSMIKTIINILIVVLIIQVLYVPTVQAAYWDDIINAGDNFLKEGIDNGQGIVDGTTIKTATNNMYNILLAIGIVASVIVGMILGIKYMTSSVEEQAKVKETLIVYVIGCIVTFGAFGIWKIALTLMSQV